MMLGMGAIGVGALGAHPFPYHIRAADTPEGQERLRAYYEALGRFAAEFAATESAMQRALRHYAQTPAQIARSVFSGTRTKTCGEFIIRICDATGIDRSIRDELDGLFRQLRIINEKRDHIFHYGAQSIAEGAGEVTNALVAHLPQKVASFPISPDILGDMTADLNKISVCLLSRHAGLPPLQGALNQHALSEALRAAWRYTPPPSPDQKSRKPEDLESPKPKVRKDRPRPSQE